MDLRGLREAQHRRGVARERGAHRGREGGAQPRVEVAFEQDAEDRRAPEAPGAPLAVAADDETRRGLRLEPLDERREVARPGPA